MVARVGCTGTTAAPRAPSRSRTWTHCARCWLPSVSEAPTTATAFGSKRLVQSIVRISRGRPLTSRAGPLTARGERGVTSLPAGAGRGPRAAGPGSLGDRLAGLPALAGDAPGGLGGLAGLAGL